MPITPVHEKLYDDASAAVNLLFSDNSVDAVVTRDSLMSLKEEINIMLQALGDDLEEEPVEPEEELEEEE